MKTAKTVVIIDYNTHKLTDLLDILTETYPVSVMSPLRLPDLPVPVSKVLSVVLLCQTPDKTVLKAIQSLKMCYGELMLAVLSPKPSMAMITETLTMGATDYFDLAEDDSIRFFNGSIKSIVKKAPPQYGSGFLHGCAHKRLIIKYLCQIICCH